MKFAHLSDCHIGAWREDTLRDLNLKSFEKAIETCIQEHVAFIIIAGDLFDTAMPSVDMLKVTASILHRLKEYDIPVYVIPGSHDFSTSGKTMLDVLENSGLITNVMKFNDNKLIFTEDRTGIKLTGMYGKKGGLETQDYEKLEKQHLEDEKGFKIFLFHTLLTELKPDEFEKIETKSLSILPKGFNYYAGGHPHFIYSKKHENYGIISYPGPIFPNNFQELEKLKHGGFFIVEASNEVKANHIPLKIIDTISYFINAENKTPQEIEQEVYKTINNHENKLITLRIEGCLKSGKISDINIRNIDDIENSLMKEYSKNSIFNEEKMNEIMKSLDKKKFEGEKISDFEIRIIKELKNLIEL